MKPHGTLKCMNCPAAVCIAPAGTQSNRIDTGSRVPRRPRDQIPHRAQRINKRESHAADAHHVHHCIRQIACQRATSAPRRPAETAGSARCDPENSRASSNRLHRSGYTSRYHFSKSISSASNVSRLRKNAMMIPSPTAASAAASVIIKIANTCPSTEPIQPRERHQIDVHRIQNQLDAHQNNDHVAARDARRSRRS